MYDVASSDTSSWRSFSPKEMSGGIRPLQKRINELFPATRWEKNDRADLKALLSQIKGGGVDPNAPVWFGGMAPTFQLSADVDGNVKSMTVSRVERSEIRLLCRRLGLIYLDLQADGLLGMLFR